MDEVERRLATLMLVGELRRMRQDQPEQTTLRLVSDGWELCGGNLTQPLPVSVDLAYEISGCDQTVLDKTRQLCGTLRLRAKRNPVAQEQLENLRAGLEKARAVKADRDGQG